ncbi:SIR2 family NAD-dependent protein deacylase [Clostridium tyrobutyricum]|uniref:SIR2 family NAD-dependent protein deacylase n=1 Tax=Clostridium tyrobutyricum TaxID=1519 RepID=UPI001C3817BC|nr:SIR2 family protein [Clostridium tyrobutyricum]MBV4417453.1 SIR2 family protein [Clostridium tyrobutyricum]
MNKYEIYKNNCINNIKECLNNMECQPILFLGSGISKRYFDAPNWEQLLKILSDKCSSAKKYGYYKQTYVNPIEIGTKLSDVYKEWAWSDGEKEFSEKYFTDKYKSDIFIKSKISDFLKSITPKNIDEIISYKDEIRLLQEIKPYAIITTNYDKFIEMIFYDYAPIIGQKILRSQYTSIGEIFKIHGCISEPGSLVFTKEDYDIFLSKKKYLSAKLLTFFLEHPLVFIGYNAGDPNIQAILSDIDEILSINNQLVPNIYIVTWSEKINNNQQYPMEKIINLENDKSIRINQIVANDFKWVYKAFTNEEAIERVNPKLLRALLSRTYELVRADIPKRKIEIDYETLESALNNDNEINKIYGITSISDPKTFNIAYPYTLTQVGQELGFRNWYKANELIEQIKDEKGFDIKSTDNKYHISVKTGQTSESRKYSKLCIELLRKVMNGDDYKV